MIVYKHIEDYCSYIRYLHAALKEGALYSNLIYIP